MTTYQYRHRWTARMLKRHVFPTGGAGLGLRPFLALRVRMADLPGPVHPMADESCYRPHDLPWPLPAWLDFEGEARLDAWRESDRQTPMPPTWKYVNLYPGKTWMLIDLVGYGKNTPPPLDVVAVALNKASSLGIRVAVGVVHRRTTGARTLERRERRYWRTIDKVHALAGNQRPREQASRDGGR